MTKFHKKRAPWVYGVLVLGGRGLELCVGHWLVGSGTSLVMPATHLLVPPLGLAKFMLNKTA